jgi:hypothetical protein
MITSGGKFEFLELNTVPEAVCEHMGPWNSMYLSEAVESLELTIFYLTPSAHSISPGTYCTLSDTVLRTA